MISLKTRLILRKLALVIKFLVAPKVWKAPPRRDVLIYDRGHSEVFRLYLNPTDYEILDIRGESINVVILLRLILKLQINFGSYVDEFISSVCPKIVITHIDLNENFYLLKYRHPSVFFLSAQSSRRSKYSFPFVKLGKGASQPYICDAVLVYSRDIAKFYQDYIEGPIISVGSIKANLLTTTDNNAIYDMCFISTFRDPKGDLIVDLNNRKIPHETFFKKPDILILNFLILYARDKGFSISVAGCSQDWQREYDYYSAIIGSDFYFNKKTDYWSSYRFLSKSKVLVSIDSALGYEALAIGHRIAMFPIRANLLNEESYKFGWPTKMPDRGPFWTNEPDEAHFKEILDYLFYVEDEEWKKTVRLHAQNIMDSDYRNSQFVYYLKMLGIQIRDHEEVLKQLGS